MKSISKKACAAVLCGAMALTASGCSNTTANAITIDGMDVRAGIYIYYQMDALNDAAEVLQEEQPEVDMYAEDFKIFNQTIEGVSAEEWVKNKAIDYCKEFVTVNKLFDEYGLTLTADEVAEIDSYVTGIWTEENGYAQYIYGVDVIGEYYEKLGIGEQSYKDITTAGYKKEAVFNYLYGEGGPKAVAAEEVDMQVAVNYALIKSFKIDPAVNSPQDYLDMLNGGMSFAEVEQAYNKDDAIAGIKADMEAAAAKGEEYTGTLPEEVEVALSDEANLTSVISVDDQYPALDFVKSVFALANGESKVVTASNTSTSSMTGEESTAVEYYLVTRMDITADEATMSEYRSAALHDLKDEEFDATLKTTSDAYAITENAAAMKKYTVKSLDGKSAM